MAAITAPSEVEITYAIRADHVRALLDKAGVRPWVTGKRTEAISVNFHTIRDICAVAIFHGSPRAVREPRKRRSGMRGSP
ncbi:MAG: hypothetical protein EA400_06570, partial [Chromatiaceae bacterium]